MTRRSALGATRCIGTQFRAGNTMTSSLGTAEQYASLPTRNAQNSRVLV
jgi:hypothetical protein